MESTYDVVVVGSGFGGGVTACRMAEQGLRVCVLERGRRFGPGDFPDRPEQAPLAFWHPLLNPGGMLDLRLMKDLAVITAAGVGGGSLVYANVQLRAPGSVFERATLAGRDHPRRARPLLRPHRGGARAARDAADPERPLRKVRAFDNMAERAGRAASGCRSPCTSAKTAAIRSAASSSRAARTWGAATWAARCWPRTPSTSPTSRAPKRTGPRCSRCTRWLVSSPRAARRELAGRLPRSQYRTSGSVEAPLLVLAAGTIGSSRLLLRTAAGCPACPGPWEAASRATATHWHSPSTPPHPG